MANPYKSRDPEEWGYSAHEAGIQFENCPYSYTTEADKAAKWRAGWRKARAAYIRKLAERGAERPAYLLQDRHGDKRVPTQHGHYPPKTED